MTSALIGYTGLVGGTLLRQTQFDDLYNRSNIESIAGRSYDMMVCAGAPAQKWLANREPEPDRANLARLMAALATVQARQVVLISTVDVLPTPIDVDESAAIDTVSQQPYGRHRYELEQSIQERFQSLVVRLPGLFGPGLKKNVIFDFLHGNQVDAIHSDSSYQFYPLDWLSRDIETALRRRLNLVHFATEPTTVHEIAAEVFGREFVNRPAGPVARYDFRSQFAGHFGGKNGYLYSREQVLDEMRRFVQSVRSLAA
jgi:nucleoside-diphosphate-sugar epimerase